MAKELSEFQKKRKAQSIVDRLDLQDDLKNLKQVIQKLFNDAPLEVREAYSEKELESLISEIKNGTANNNKVAKFLELAGKLKLG